MAQAGFTPISLYSTTTASAVPLAANLVAGEVALNTTDGKMYFKNTGGVVTLLSSVLTAVANGGTGVTTSTGTGSVVLNTSPTLVTPILGVASASSLTTTGDALIGGTGTSIAGAQRSVFVTPPDPATQDAEVQVRASGAWIRANSTNLSNGGFGGFQYYQNGVQKFSIAAGGGGDQTMLFSTGTTERARFDSSGNLIVGTTNSGLTNSNGIVFNPSGNSSLFQHVNGTASGSGYIAFAYNGGVIGSIAQTGTTAVLYNTTSDYRLKANQQPLTGSGAFIDALKPTTWEWTRDGRKDSGFIAHEFQNVVPNSVTGIKDETEEQEYEISPEVPATQDADGIELTPAVPAVMGTRSVPKYQAMQASSPEVIANLVAELQSLRKRIAVLEAK